MHRQSYSWVNEITTFFEGLSRRSTSIRHRQRPSPPKQPARHLQRSSNTSSEHCVSVSKGRQIFDKMDDLAKTRYKQANVSSYDIFSGIDDPDIPVIEAEVAEPGVYSRADPSPSPSPSTAKCKNSSNGNAAINCKKSVPKSLSFSSKRANFRKQAPQFQTVCIDDDSESKGVILRMKDQEIAYEHRDKYQSIMPDVQPLQVPMRRSAPKSHESTDTRINRDIMQNSVLMADIPLPPLDINQNVLDSSRLDEDDESEELEPSVFTESFTDIRTIQLISQGPRRIFWAETEEGKKLIRIQNLSPDIIKWQEAQFEVITSEASYYKSLEILVNKIYKSSYMACVNERLIDCDSDNDKDQIFLNTPLMTPLQKHHLFSNILEIHLITGELLRALETRWREDAFLQDLSDIFVEFCKSKLKPYVTYLRNQQYQTSTFNELLQNANFKDVTKKFESDPECGNMNLSAFLLLPMQRPTRLKLLMQVVKKYTPPDRPTDGCDAALAALEELIKECSEQKMLMEQKEQILKIINKLKFREQTGHSIGNKPLLKDGPLRVLSTSGRASRSVVGSGSDGRGQAQMYVFEDLLIMAKTRRLPLCVSSGENDKEMVVEICPRSDISFDPIDTEGQSKSLLRSMRAAQNQFRLILNKGVKGKAEYTCDAVSKEEFEKWQKALSSADYELDEYVFNEVLVTKDYQATSDRELTLKEGQILCLTKHISSDRALATLNGKVGEVPLSHVTFVTTPTANMSLLREIRNSIVNRRMD